ncbi:hypothetical protein [Deinococcus humi]|uniref:Uncharacterized protein n=1 Tax=Deinococcus humi TaxID=662880 RepID=A0A7W8JTR6_9DEIO|nr:hypothetical protein [Deinococcus humi]MBB5363065.1 hypothetical protein [Deinococcus humi]GGO24887.1 hypothetical protein GCM10008949_14200 [Deinococcus humi]
MTSRTQEIRAVCITAELLAATESFEQTGCAFGLVSNAYIRAMGKYPHAETFDYKGMAFELAPFPRVVLVLSHAAKPVGPGGSNSLRPFAELLVTHAVQKVRLISDGPYRAWLEVSLDGQRWRRLRREGDPPAREPPPTTVIEPRIPAPRPDLEVDL